MTQICGTCGAEGGNHMSQCHFRSPMNTVVTLSEEELKQKKERLELSIEVLIMAFEVETKTEVNKLTLLRYPLWKDGLRVEGEYTKVYVEVG